MMAESAKQSGGLPPITLATTMLNERPMLSAFLASLEAQTTWPDEIVVVDGGSSDGTVELWNEWSHGLAIKVRIIVAEGANISKGRNTAIAEASNEVIVVTDAGTVLDPAWLGELVGALGPDVDVISGFFEADGETFLQKSIAYAITPNASEIDPDRFLPSSRSICFRRSSWERAGGYPEWLDYCEDLVFDLAMLNSGSRFAFVPGAIVRWSARSTYRAFAKQYYRYARGDGKAGLWSKRHAARYVAYIFAVLVVGTRFGGLIGVAVLVLGFLAYARRFLWRIVVSRRKFKRLLPVALLLTLVTVVVGDLAKMAGYPVGLRWRRKNMVASDA